MPYLQKATDNPSGFHPYDAVLRIGTYWKDSSAAAIYPGDALVMESDGGIAVAGVSPAQAVIGVAAEYSVVSTEKKDFLVYDHPDQLFWVQDDGDTTAMTEAQLGQNVDMITTTGDTTLLRSKHELDSSSADVTAGIACRVVRLHPIEADSYATAAGSPRKWVVQFNPDTHALSSATGT